MNLSPYLKLNRIEFIATYHCTGRCAHCSVGDKIGRTYGERHIRGRESAEAVRRLAELFPMESVMTFGGEPLLWPEPVLAVHAAARDGGIPVRQMITNGYFSRSPAEIRRVAQAIGDSGVNDLLLSVDAFHQARIPMEPVRLFAEELLRDGRTPVRLAPSWVVNREFSCGYNDETRRIVAEFAELGIPESAGNDIFLAGNAARNLAEYYPAPGLRMDDSCGSMPYSENLDALHALSVEPNGDVVACAFVIGNLYRENLDDILKRYDPWEDEGMRAAMGGAEALLQLAQKRGIAVDPAKCYSVCDLCRAVNRA